MKLGEAILKGEVRAYGQYANLVRARGGTYNETYARVCAIFTKAGRTPPSPGDFEEKMMLADDDEARG